MIATDWSVSGLCVTARHEDMEAVEVMLNRLPGIEVHGRDPHSGRLVVVQERCSIEEHKQGLRELQSLPGVLTAELVVHFQDPEDQSTPTTSGGAS